MDVLYILLLQNGIAMLFIVLVISYMIGVFFFVAYRSIFLSLNVRYSRVQLQQSMLADSQREIFN